MLHGVMCVFCLLLRWLYLAFYKKKKFYMFVLPNPPPTPPPSSSSSPSSSESCQVWRHNRYSPDGSCVTIIHTDLVRLWVRGRLTELPLRRGGGEGGEETNLFTAGQKLAEPLIAWCNWLGETFRLNEDCFIDEENTFVKLRAWSWPRRKIRGDIVGLSAR